MKETAKKLSSIEGQISRAKGPFSLFALFLREDAPDVWDLVVAAPWIESNQAQALKYIAEKMGEALTPDELTRISRIVLIDENNPDLDALQTAFSVQHGLVESRNSEFFGLPIKHSYIMTSQKLAASSEAS